ncbi:uncharacterized protein LOC124147704 isoform X1 [Haliotis rufescens]|uniref:uncharacterized protein LOC124147704 isoform X1 n=1 Tax=Haliotis rufescens TaxID=6454 RepID=UPI00201E7CB4|nr:uncharacterized protein LOC124147704 isoform X1 [Haliotis rufescens]
MRLIVFLLSAVCAATMTGASLRSRRDAGYLGSRLALDKMLMDVDTDNNSIIIRSELFNNQGQGDTDNNGFISRCEWVNRAVDIYDDSKLAALNYFDIIDTNRDNKLTTSDTDFPSLDADGDREVSISELRQVLQRDYTMAIDSAAYKKLEQLSRVAAPQGGDIKSTLRIDLIKKDVDSNNDGDVTRTELQAHFISSFDKDDDYKVTRCEFVGGSVARYADRKEVAIAAFDNLDITQNNYIDINDIKLSRFDQDGSGKLTVEEFEVAVIQADWVALKKVYPQATTPAPPTGGAVSPYPSMLLAGCIFVLKVWT